uniref:Terpine synthase-like protein MTPSL4 n=1 Tax=Anthoceros punctatus TaxID=3234 RepID=A0A2P1ED38_ANTPU|nr:terpine synthase-like protein MTPSL4 [Anthoceros punctatus]
MTIDSTHNYVRECRGNGNGRKREDIGGMTASRTKSSNRGGQLSEQQATAAGRRSGGIMSLGIDKATLRTYYLELLQDLSFTNTRESCYPDPESVGVISSALSSLCGSYVHARMINLSASASQLCYKLHPMDIRIKIAHFIALTLTVDDLSESLRGEARRRFLDDLAFFQMKFTDPAVYAKLCPGRGDLHPSLEDFIAHLKSEQSPFFPWDIRLHAMLVKCVLDFVEANQVEQHYAEHPLVYTLDMPYFPTFLRHKAGMSEGFAYFSFILDSSVQDAPRDDRLFFHRALYPMIPDLVEFMELLNDVLSFYREAETGDSTMWVLNQAKAHGLTPLQVLRQSAKAAIQVKKRLIASVDRSGSVELKEKLVQFCEGYVAWHVGDKRYRLDEVLGTGGWYQGGFWK